MMLGFKEMGYLGYSCFLSNTGQYLIEVIFDETWNRAQAKVGQWQFGQWSHLESPVVSSIVDPTDLYSDSNGAIAQANCLRSLDLISNPTIYLDTSTSLEILSKRECEICRVPAKDNIVDPLTKAFAQRKHNDHTRSLGIRDMFDQLYCEIVDVSHRSQSYWLAVLHCIMVLI